MAYDLISFWSNYDDNEDYAEFYHAWLGVLTMAVHKYTLGWVAEITDDGYAKIEEAYNLLRSLGWGSENDNLV
jgi:hypothetical protein